MAMTISIDDQLKQDFSATCKAIGLTPSTAFGIFAKAVVREQGMPFSLSAISREERWQRSVERQVNEELWESYRAFEADDALSREESQALRRSRSVEAVA